MSSVTSLRCAIALLLAAPAMVAVAQSEVGDVSQPEAASQLEEVVVTARARSEDLQEVPDAVTAFSASAIEAAGIDEVNDFVRLTPAVTLVEASQSPGIALLNIRGIGQQLNQEAPVAIVVDGVQTASSAALTQALLDVERIEVLKGPQGALYGRNAIGGALNITTREPSGEFEGSIAASMGNHDYEALNGLLTGPLGSDRVRYKLVANYSDYAGDFRNAFTGTLTNPREDWNVRGRLVADLTARVTLDVRASTSETTNAGYNAVILGTARADDFSGRPLSDRRGDGLREIDEYSLQAQFETALGTWTATSAFIDTLDESSYDLDQRPVFLIDLAVQRTMVEAFSQELRLTSNDSRKLRYTAGAYLLDTDLQRATAVDLSPLVTGASGVVRLPTDTQQDNRAWAGFAQLNYDLSDALELTGALRYDRDEREQLDLLTGTRQAADFSQLQPKASVAWKVNDARLLYATYAEGFRSGGFNQPVPAFPLVFDKEASRAFELGLKNELFERRLRLNVAAFHTEQENQQVTLIDVAGTGAQGTVNIPETTFNGAEIELQAALSDQWALTTGLSWIDSEIIEFGQASQYEGNQSPYTARWTYSVGVDYRRALSNGWDLELHGDYAGQSRMYYEYFNTIEQPSYGLANLRLSTHNQRWRITAFIENAFDERYYSDVASNITTSGLGDLGIKGRARRYGMMVGMNF